MAGFAVLIGAGMGSASALSTPALLAALAAFLICGAGNTINDYYDYEIDLVNAPARPIPSGAMSLGSAHAYALLLFATGIIVSTPINLPALAIALFNSILLYLYAKRIKRAGGLAKNLTVSYLVASPFFFGGVAVESPYQPLFLSFVAFTVNTAREVVKDIEDYEGDAGYLQSLPVRYGFTISGLLATLFLAAALALSIIPYYAGMVTVLYLPFISAADILVLYSALAMLRSPAESAGRVQRLIKAAMLLALLGFFLGTL